MTIGAVLFDLDDTLYPQGPWLEGAWDAVAAAGEAFGADRTSLRECLEAIAARGSDRERIIDRAVALSAPNVPVAPLVETFLSFVPERADVYPGIRSALTGLRSFVPIALVTDGHPELQRAKLRRLGLDHAFDAVVLSDCLGRDRRKPHPTPFRLAARLLQVPAASCVVVGDGPDTDVAGAIAAGMHAVRVRTGEYSSRPDEPAAWLTVRDAVEAATRLASRLAAAGAVVRQANVPVLNQMS